MIASCNEHYPKGILISDYHFSEHPLFDNSQYTTFQIILFTSGALLWCVAYLFTIYNAYFRKKLKTLDIPVVAVLLNFGSEITTAFFWLPDMGNFLVAAYWAWLLLDAFIVAAMFKYGWQQFARPAFKSMLKTVLLPSLLFSFLLQLFFILQYDIAMAPLDNFTINLVMSICFINLIYVPGFAGNSEWVGWCKFIGTGLISVMFYLKYPENNYLTLLYIGCAIFDILYIYLLRKQQLSAHVA